MDRVQTAREHVFAQFGFSTRREGDGLTGSADAGPELWVPGTEVLRTSVLAIWADSITGMIAADHVGGRVPVTLQLEVNLYAPPTRVSHVEVVGRLVKVGRSVVVSTAEFLDQDGRAFGTATGVFAIAHDPALRMPDDYDPVGPAGAGGYIDGLARPVWAASDPLLRAYYETTAGDVEVVKTRDSTFHGTRNPDRGSRSAPYADRHLAQGLAERDHRRAAGHPHCRPHR
ncbi:hypothetical protein CGZ93_05215 [Enemella dayhoffiae]|uniref:Thioesterase domain-containing protein n=1 Tax=Enemella dayhoffiae TaxID=2016507 RepID=A0A255H8C1_9ACTN|nr:PaaI family thioesterase [Enemella dayhoffiae]OYO23918.1 hypothetical protein CGZ93_05215 [Enemella dayhoffiae]